MSTSIWRVTSKTNEVYGMWLYIGKVSKGSLHGFMLSFGPFNLMIGKVWDEQFRLHNHGNNAYVRNIKPGACRMVVDGMTSLYEGYCKHCGEYSQSQYIAADGLCMACWNKWKGHKNPSGCCCKFDEDGETILSLCLAHKLYFEGLKWTTNVRLKETIGSLMQMILRMNWL